jgi:Lsr2
MPELGPPQSAAGLRHLRKGAPVGTLTQTILVDDLDGTKAEETITFGLDGVTYEIDLSGGNAALLREALDPFVAKGRWTSAQPSTAPKSSASSAEIRARARTVDGSPLADRGGLPVDVVKKYNFARNL